MVLLQWSWKTRTQALYDKVRFSLKGSIARCNLKGNVMMCKVTVSLFRPGGHHQPKKQSLAPIHEFQELKPIWLQMRPLWPQEQKLDSSDFCETQPCFTVCRSRSPRCSQLDSSNFCETRACFTENRRSQVFAHPSIVWNATMFHRNWKSQVFFWLCPTQLDTLFFRKCF